MPGCLLVRKLLRQRKHLALVRKFQHLLSFVAGQGGWETDETVEAAAARETVEEAGVRGALEVRVVALSQRVSRLCLWVAGHCRAALT